MNAKSLSFPNTPLISQTSKDGKDKKDVGYFHLTDVYNTCVSINIYNKGFDETELAPDWILA